MNHDCVSASDNGIKIDIVTNKNKIGIGDTETDDDFFYNVAVECDTKNVEDSFKMI